MMDGNLTSARAPRATYRVQLTEAFGFDHVAAIAPYLSQLGVSHVYLSPILQAAPGSTHGYDVVDHQQLSAELGGIDGYQRMSAALIACGVRQVLDIVPNHMAIGSDLEIRIPFSNYAARRGDADFSTSGRVIHVRDAASLGEKLVGVQFTGPRFPRVFRSESTG